MMTRAAAEPRLRLDSPSTSKERVFVGVALGCLVLLYAGYVDAGMQQRGPYVWALDLLLRFDDHHLSPQLAFVLGLVPVLLAWAVVAFPLRRLLMLPRRTESGMAYLARVHAMEIRSRRDPERRAFYRSQGRIFLLISGTLLAISAGMWAVTGGLFLLMPVLGGLGLVGAMVQIATGSRFGRFGYKLSELIPIEWLRPPGGSEAPGRSTARPPRDRSR